MKSRCRTCAHPEREAIDAALKAGRSAGSVAAAFGLPSTTVQNHKLRHVFGGSRLAAKTSPAAVDPGIVELAELLRSRISDAARLKNARGVAQLSKSFRKLLEDMREAELRARALAAPVRRNPFLRPAARAFCAEMLATLDPWPECREAAERLLEEFRSR